MANKIQIPFLDLSAQHNSIKTDLDLRIKSALASFQFCKGREVTDFELSFANVLGVANCVATGNGTDALFLILKALGISPGHEVITPAFSWISSAEVITLSGATPIFADVDRETYTIDINDVISKITSRTKAVIAVHLYGNVADIVRLQELCKKRNLWLIEDCAQAHLSTKGGRYAGTFGVASAFSFYPTKNLGAYGDAGCVVTSDATLAEKIRRLANHGALNKDDHLIEGLNSRMDTLQAAVLLAKIPCLKEWNKKRQQHALQYFNELCQVKEIVLPNVAPDTTHTFHLFVIRTAQRDALKNYLEDAGIQTLIHYPKALINLPPYQKMTSHFPVSSKLEKEVLSLPIYPELTKEAISYVCTSIKKFYK